MSNSPAIPNEASMQHSSPDEKSALPATVDRVNAPAPGEPISVAAQPPGAPAAASGQHFAAVPAPAVVSQIETVSPVQSAPMLARAPVTTADIPLTDPPVETKIE